MTYASETSNMREKNGKGWHLSSWDYLRVLDGVLGKDLFESGTVKIWCVHHNGVSQLSINRTFQAVGGVGRGQQSKSSTWHGKLCKIVLWERCQNQHPAKEAEMKLLNINWSPWHSSVPWRHYLNVGIWALKNSTKYSNNIKKLKSVILIMEFFVTTTTKPAHLD